MLGSEQIVALRAGIMLFIAASAKPKKGENAMPKKTKMHEVKVQTPAKDVGTPRMPHERDEATDKQSTAPRKDMKQAAADLARGLVDTDMHGQRGVEEVVKQPTDPRQKTEKKSKT
jgi:hypothetical protein